MQDLNHARDRARAVSAARGVVFDVAASSYRIPGETDLRNAAATYTARLADPPYSAAIGTANFGGAASVSFNAYGVASGGGSVTVRAGGVVRTVVLNGDTGVVTIQ
jgi:hypothetical protein